MREKEFCLLEEPWIRVLRQDCTVEEVSLVDALVRAHTFRALAGELPTQDAAMLRLLLAVLYAVFARTREAGGAEPLADADDALQRWQTLWEGGHFPEQPIRAYLEAYRERFYLFHPERPFWQAKAAVGTYFKAAKLNGGPIKVRVREAGDEIIQENNAKVDELIGHAQELDIEIKTL